MPPRTRASKITKTLKENSNFVNKSKLKISMKSSKQPRKVLADKTNSASEDVISLPITEKHLKISESKSRKPLRNIVSKIEKTEERNTGRSRRVRRLPNRYEENNVLRNLSNSNPLSTEKLISPNKTSEKPLQKVSIAITEHPLKVLNSPLINKRPKRIHRLPNKFNDHTLSPIKPVHASTPKANKENKVPIKKGMLISNHVPKALKVNNKDDSKEKNKDTVRKEKNRDTNNNGHKQETNSSFNTPATVSLISTNANKSPSQYQKSIILKKQLQKNNSLRLLDKNASIKRDASKLDVYEFTFDPNEEPPPLKKRKKRVIKKNPNKTKAVTIKSNYDKNLAKALAALKKTVSAKSSQPSHVEPQKKITVEEDNININVNETKMSESLDALISASGQNKYNSVRIEDIALQCQEVDNHPINYSPVYSPVNSPVISPVNSPSISPVNSPVRIPPVDKMNVDQKLSEIPHNKDPLNLLDNISFFDEHPIASSSINTSVRHPSASPWRVEFGNLPIKWPVNAYVKPNMTPAVETSYIDSSENKNKHVYTNIISETNKPLPQIVENTPNLKQTSIISFIKEVIERSANKKKKKKIVNNNSVFEEVLYNKPASYITPLETHWSENISSPVKSIENVKNTHSNILADKGNNHNLSREIVSEDCKPKDADKDVTYFGFDESEDQENISPIKKNNKARVVKSQMRSALHEINDIRIPEKVLVPQSSAKSKSALNNADKVFNEMKSAMEPPVFPEANVLGSSKSTNIDNPILQNELENDESQSVHLFEDIEIVHHLKPTRKSYSKTKKVTFRQNSADSDSFESDDNQHNSSGEDLDDLSFKLPSVKEKRVTKKKIKKKQLSKKEEKEVEAWAAGFNSMCEDIDEYDLVVE